MRWGQIALNFAKLVQIGVLINIVGMISMIIEIFQCQCTVNLFGMCIGILGMVFVHEKVTGKV